ncbi:DUF2147 domain-containing protein [Aurantibacter sp.]|uniref:DUF2147 domain-containing protein n=1 Tax=Aurantibacter sp. TaxID=2807103 RepID=UPI0035C878AF
MRVTLIICLFLISQFANSQSILGKWKTIDKNGTEKCIVEIYQEKDKIYGKIIEILVEEDKEALCVKCEGSEKDQPILGLVLIKEMEKDGEYYRNGTIFDPEHGEKFKCRITLENDNTLEVRGYLSFLYSTQYWERV